MAQELPSNSNLDKDDIINLLDVDDDTSKTELPKEEKPEEEVKVEPEEEEEKIELTEEPEEEEDEIISPPTRKEILTKYPNIFKDFPQLQASFYRERQYTEILPTIKDAKVAVEKAETLDKFEASLFSGKTDDILKAVKNEKPESFNKLVDDYLPALARVDKEAYLGVLTNVVSHTLKTMYDQGKAGDDADLVTAVGILNKAIFGTNQLQTPKTFAKPDEKNPEVEKLQKEREEFTRQRFEHARNGLSSKVDNIIKSTINQHIDPREVMTDFIKEVAVERAQKELDNLISQDNNFSKAYDRLWEKAFESNFSQQSLDKIRSAYINKAQSLLPTVIKNSRNNALKGMGKKAEGDKKGPLPVGRSTSTSSKSAEKKEIPKNMSNADYLLQD